MKSILYLASESPSRKKLLEEANIPFKHLSQSADESACDWTLPVEQLIMAIALHKMDHVVLPDGAEGDRMFVLTADTMSQDKDGTVNGKPVDREDAILKIRAARDRAQLYTAFCLDLKEYKNGSWHTRERIHEAVGATYQFIVPDEWIDRYLDTSMGMTCSNAIAIEGYGEQFLKEIQGSYSTIVGLPMYELREALTRLGFEF